MIDKYLTPYYWDNDLNNNQLKYIVNNLKDGDKLIMTGGPFDKEIGIYHAPPKNNPHNATISWRKFCTWLIIDNILK